MSHTPEECDHVWSAWQAREYPLAKNSPDVIIGLMRKCYSCGKVEDARDSNN